ncbi:MAG: hypothetical protein JNK65_07805, partial [Deltaproteobacteria bacterium]|nr:hypothetical protein [Deltaproteobacteria bacterium]
AARTADTSRTPQTFQQHVHTQSSQTSQFVRSSNPQTQHPQQGQPTANTYSSGFVSARNTSPTPSQTGTARSEGNQPRTPSQERQSPTHNARPSSNGSLLFQQNLTPRFASSFVEKAAHFAQSQRPESFLRQSPSLENTSNGSHEVKNGHRSAFSEALNPRFSSEFGSILKSLSQASSSPKLFSMLQTLPPSLKGLLLTLIPSQNNPFLSKLIPFSQKMNLGLETLTRTHKGSLEADATLEMLPEEAVLNEVLEELVQSHPLFQGSSLSFPNLMDRLQKMMNQFSKILFGTFSLKDTPEKAEAEQLLLMQLAIFMKLKEKLEKKSLKKSKTSFTEEIEEEFWEELEKNFEDPQHRGRFFQNKDLLQNIHY